MKLVEFLKMVLEKTKKLWFPGVLFAFELVILILFALLVEYDEGGQAEHEEAVARLLANKTNSSNGDDVILQLDSTRSTTKVYPCKNNYTRNYMYSTVMVEPPKLIKDKNFHAFSTSEERTASLQRTKWLVPTCPLLVGCYN